MKKELLLGTALLVAVGSFSQNGKTKPNRIINARTISEYKYGAQESQPSSIKPLNPDYYPPRAKQSASTGFINTWQAFTSSMNIYGSSNSFVKPLQWNDELDAVTFIHRKSPTYVSSPIAANNALNGTIVTMITTDCGDHWDSTAMWVNDNYWGRFPSGAIYNPSGNTNIDNTYMVGAGPTTGNGNVTWIGNWYASKKLGASNYNNAPSTAQNAQQLITTAGLGPSNTLSRHDFSAYNFSATDDGKMRILAGIHNDATSRDTAVMLMTGMFNTSSLTFDWVGKVITPPTTTNSLNGTSNWISRPMMAWNEQGDVGYIVVMGSLLGATGSNVGYQPIVYKTINSGATWALQNSIDFNLQSFNALKNRLQGVVSDSTLVVPKFNVGEGIDCSVDANNKLHIFGSIMSHARHHPDSLDYIYQYSAENYLWPHTEGELPYLYDFVYDGTNTVTPWTHMLIDSMATEGPGVLTTEAGYDDNPWNADPNESNRKFAIDARLQMSRTPDGQHLVYTWTESDTAFTTDQKKWNTFPNIKARMFDVANNVLNPVKLDITVLANGNVADHATCHFVSPKCKLIATYNTDHIVGKVLELPITVSNSMPYSQLTQNLHWYSCATLDFTVSGVGVAENKINSVNNANIFPNPAKDNATLSIDLKGPEKVEVDVLNTMGQLVKVSRTDGQMGTNSIAIDLSGLASGMYFVNVKIDNATSAKKLIIE